MSKSKTVKIENFAATLEGLLDDYRTHSVVVMKQTIKKVAGETRNEIKERAASIEVHGSSMFNTPKHTGLIDSGDYLKSWTYKKAWEGVNEIRYTVYARAPHYRLTHLLEKGHRVFIGKYYTGKNAPAYPHIEPAAEAMKSVLMDEIKVGLRYHDSR